MKKKKIMEITGIIIICVAIIIGIVLKRTSVVSTNNLLSDTDKSATTVSFGGEKNIPTYNVTLNNPIINNTNNDYGISGIDVITKASELLGTKYQYGEKAGAYNDSALSKDNLTQIDCSGLVWWTLKSLDVEASGFNTGTGSKTTIPIDTNHWIFDNSGNYYKERKAWKYSVEYKSWQEINKGPGKSIRNADLEVNNKKVNVLKINDPITSGLRYYEYYDNNGNKKELPVGTIVISDGKALEENKNAENKYSHAWICIGNLGTSNETEAAKILKNMKVISEGQEEYVKQASNNCTYWRIESTSDKGREGVTINNADPDYNEGDKKIMGPIWAFQVASDIKGSYHMNIVKKDETSNTDLNNYSDALAGAEFEVIQYKNNSTEGIKGKSENKNILETTNDQTPIYFSNKRDISIDNTTFIDKYTIKETKAPEGYKLNGGQITLEVTKKANGNEYCISNVRVYAGKFAKDLKPGSNNTVQLTLGLNSVSDVKAHSGYVIGVQISKNSITITYKNSIDDIDVVINKTNLSGQKIPNVRFNYWVFDDSNGRPNENNISKTVYSQSNEYLTIKGMKKNTSKYVWITEINENSMYTNGFFDTSGLENKNTTRYIYMKINCNNDGKITISPVDPPFYLYQIVDGELNYLARNSEANTVKKEEMEDSQETEYYIETDKITVEENSDGKTKITVPIRNPSRKIDYNLGIGKEMFNGNLQDFEYNDEKDRIDVGDTSNLVAGAKFEVKRATSSGAGIGTDWEDIGNSTDSSGNNIITTERGKFVDIASNIDSESYPNLWFRFSEIEGPNGTEINKYTYFVKIENVTFDSKYGNRQIKIYKYSPEKIKEMSDSEIKYPSEEIFKGNMGKDAYYVDEENGVIITFDVKSLNIKFLMIDKANINNYNINIAKLSKSDIKDFESDELNSEEIKKKFIKNIEFETTQKKRKIGTGEVSEGKSDKIVTIGGDYTSAYSDVSVIPNWIDMYTFKETGAPYNFDLYDKTIEMIVINGAREDAYEAGAMAIGVDSNNDGQVDLDELLLLEIDSNSNEKVTRAVIPKNPSHAMLNDNVYVMIEKNDTNNVNITLILADETIEGSYKMNIVKKELKDNTEDDYSNENAKYISTLSNAKFSVKQALNNSEKSEQGTMLQDVITQEGTVSSIVNDVNITDISNSDTYWINEIATPSSFSMNKLDFKLDIYKKKENKKYIIDYVQITDQTNKYDEIIEKGETLYINSKRKSKEYFESYVVAITLVENDGTYAVNITWRDEKPIYNINLYKTNSNTGETIDAIAEFDIQMYEDENFTNKAEFIDINNNDLNGTYQTENSQINIENIVIPDVESGTKTNYLTITEKNISDENYRIMTGTLVIPITFIRETDGKLTYSKGVAYLIDNINTKNKIDEKINPDRLDADATEEFDNAKITTTTDGDNIKITVPNEYPGEVTFKLIKYGKPISSGVNEKILNGAEFEIVINKTDEEGKSEEIYRSNPYDITGVNTSEEDGVIRINNIKIHTGDLLTFKIKEISTLDGYEIPKELKNGITYTAKIGNFNSEKQKYDIELENNSNISEDIATGNILKNRTILVSVENNQIPKIGKYKITIVKNGSDSKLMSDVVFHRKVCIRENSKITDEDYNIKKENDLNPTDTNGCVIVTKGIETDESETVNVPLKGYGSPDIYEITENDLTDINAKQYKKIPEKLNLEINKGIDSVSGTTYANVAIFSIGENQNREYIYINELTHEWKRWAGSRDDINDTNKLVDSGTYIENTEIPLNFVSNGVEYNTSVKLYTDSENLITNIVVGVVNPRQPISSKYKVNIKKVGTNGTALDGIVFGRTAKLNVDQTTGTAEKTVSTDMEATSNGGYASVTKDVETSGSEIITVSKDNYTKSDTYKINEKSLGTYDNTYSKYPYDINLVVEKKYKNYTAGVDKAILTINNETKEIDLSDIAEQKITVTDENGEDLDVIMNATKENNEVTITLTIENSEIISVPVEKRWVDGNDENKIRPTSINVELKYKKDGNWVKYEKDGVENPVTLNEANSWKYTWENLPKNINGSTAEYTVEESVVPYGYTVNKTTEKGVIILTNTHEVTNIVAKSKQWKNVTNANLYRVDMELYKKGETTKIGDTKSVIGNDMATWRNLEKYNANDTEIEYVVKETKAYYRTDENSEEWIELEEGKDYVADEQNDVFINTIKVKTSIPKSKQWRNVAADKLNLYKVKVRLYANGEATNKEQDIVGNGTATFNDLDKYDADGNEIKYEVKEIAAYYRTSETSLWNELEKDKDYVADEENGVFINTRIEKTNIQKSKQWRNVADDNLNLYEVKVRLYANGEATNKERDIVGNGTATFNNLDKYDADGNEIKYEVKEIAAYYRTSETSLWNELEEGKDYVADEENGVFINTWVTPGKYKIMLSKIEKDSKKAISGVTFKVNEILTDATGTNGITYVKDKNGNQLEVNIDIDNYNVTDTYEITEINLNNKENEYYKIKDSLKVNVTKARLTDNDQITYKLDSVSFEGGTVGSDGVARKEVTLENDEKAEVTAEIIGSTVKITIPNKEKSGKYSLKLIKYKKGTQTAVAGTKFHLIGGNVGNIQFEQNNKPLSETNYKEIVTETTPVIIWQDSINIRDIATPDTYTLKEADVGENNTDMFIGFTESIKITVNKNNNYNVESIGLTVDGKEATEQNGKLVFSKTIDNQTITATLSLDKSTNTITLEVENPEKHGSFDFNLVKYIKGTETPLDGAGFKIKIVNKENNEVLKDGEGNSIDGTKEIFVENGKILIENINIAKAGITYEVTIEETTVPDGYIGLDGPITFTAVSEANADGKTYSLKTNKSTTIANAKLVEVKEDEILIEAENRVKPTIHKGVKDVKNQSSGYYNEITGDTYENIEDAKKATLPEWVIDTTLPQGVEEYKIYEISDTIDERLTYEGIASVKIIDGENIVANLVEKTDYKVSYDKETRLLKITFIGENQALSETLKQNIGKTIEVRFNTKFALDANGNIIALNQSVPNQATLTYGNGSTVNSEKPEIHTGGVGLFKYDKKTGKALSGAHFKIATSKENAENKVFLKDTEGNDVEAISGEDGVAEFTGLEFGEDALNKVEYKVNDEITGAEVYKYDWEKVQTTYYIVETESPEGYMLLEEPIEAIVKKDNYNIEDITSLIQVGNQSNKFDLKLRKWVTQAIVIENGKTVYTETGHKAEDEPEEVVKVDLRRSKLEDVVVKFKYSIRVTNEGEIAGEATEIRDDKPDGLIFVQDDNPDWRYENGDIITDKLAGTTLQPGESAEVEILLTWDNSEDNMGTMINRAEIQKDHNDYGVPDIDSTPGNRVPGEDDIDDAPVMITVKTGTDYIIYSSILLGAIAIIISGGVVIKKKVMKRI